MSEQPLLKCFICQSTSTYFSQSKNKFTWYSCGKEKICSFCYYKEYHKQVREGSFLSYKEQIGLRKCSRCGTDKTQVTITKKGYPHRKWVSDGEGGWFCHKCSRKTIYHQQEIIRKRRALTKNPRFHWARMSIGNHKRSGFSIDINLFDDLLPLALEADKCKICDVPLSWGYLNGKHLMTTPSLDRINNEKHITKNNIQIICFMCNSTKGIRTMPDFISYCKYVAKKFS